MILLNANGLEKSFGSRTIFKNLGLGIEDHDRIGLVGPNGAGKSTLLKILAGYIPADSGQVVKKKGLRIGFLEQTPSFAEGATILSTVLEKAEDQNESLGKAYETLGHLQLTQFEESQSVKTLSGGWKKRLALARELVAEPELLFLDEPTNHLDISSILWLEEFLSNADFAVVMITHDRLFLQRVVNRVLDLDSRNPHYLLSVKGDYLKYLQAKEQELSALERQERVSRNTLRRETEWLQRGAIARLKKQTARIQSAGELKNAVEELEQKNRSNRVELDFGKVGHSPKKLIEAKGVSKTYGERTLFSNLDLLITPKTRLALLGDNGSGKSTLVRALLNLEALTTGTVTLADRLKVSYFEQGRESLDFSKSVRTNICPEGDYVSCRGEYIHVRSYLDRFFFSGQRADMPVEKLSGGEQARLRLAQLMLEESQVIVLDEPTNDLDVETLEVLENSLAEYSGAVILVTHDRYFLDAVANKILAFPPPEFNTGLQTFANYFQWEEWYRIELAKSTSPQYASGVKPSNDQHLVPKEKKQRLSFKEKQEWETIEASIAALESKIADLTAETMKSEVAFDHLRLGQLQTDLAQLHRELDTKYSRWAELEKKVKLTEAGEPT